MSGFSRPTLRLALARAPRKGAAPQRSRDDNGTWVSVKAYDIAGQNLGVESKRWADHMYVEYDDGHEQIIARGGPSAKGAQMIADGLGGRLRVTGEVTPARDSQDYGRGGRVLYKTFLPYQTARQASEIARQEVARIRQGDNLYGATTNSNSVVGNITERQFGRRIGDEQTWGYKTRLGDGGRPR